MAISPEDSIKTNLIDLEPLPHVPGLFPHAGVDCVVVPYGGAMLRTAPALGAPELAASHSGKACHLLRSAPLASLAYITHDVSRSPQCREMNVEAC